jgi:hypothetical protein
VISGESICNCGSLFKVPVAETRVDLPRVGHTEMCGFIAFFRKAGSGRLCASRRSCALWPPLAQPNRRHSSRVPHLRRRFHSNKRLS